MILFERHVCWLVLSICLIKTEHCKCSLHFPSHLRHEHVCRVFYCRCASFVFLPSSSASNLNIRSDTQEWPPKLPGESQIHSCLSRKKRIFYETKSLVVGRAAFPALLGGLGRAGMHPLTLVGLVPDKIDRITPI